MTMVTGDGEAGTSSEERKTCPVVWDRLQCWPETAAGQLAIQPCAHYVDNFIIDGELSLNHSLVIAYTLRVTLTHTALLHLRHHLIQVLRHYF